MVLSNEQAKHFYDLWIPLLDYVNQKYKLVKELYGMTSPRGLPLEHIVQLSGKLWENKDVIEQFIASGFIQMSDEEISIVAGWKNAVMGEFVVERHMKRGSILVSSEDEEVYLVKGIYSSWRELLEGHPMPQIVHATLIPFQDVIIHDGLVKPYGVCLGRNKADEIRQIYLNAKADNKIHSTL